MRIMGLWIRVLPAALAIPATAHASQHLDLTSHWLGFCAVALFLVAYTLVATEEWTGLRKSTPVLIAAGFIWMLVAAAARGSLAQDVLIGSARESILDYAELLLFLLVAMTYVNAMTDRQVFAAMRDWLLRRQFSMRALFWITGLLSFFLSAVIDNLTTSLVMGSLALGITTDRRFLTLSCINIVVAANAGGAWCAFGDVTSLMVWQAGRLEFFEFFRLLLPSAVAWLLPATAMHLALPRSLRLEAPTHAATLRAGGAAVVVLFVLTLATAVSLQNLVGLPPVMGMMLGLGYLKVYGYWLRCHGVGGVGDQSPFDVFGYIARAEWDTLLFFYGVILCVGGLATFGYMELLADLSYSRMGPTVANILVGVVSAVVDNIPVMAAVLEMNPPMSQGQWLLITLTAGIGGSLLSIGSAAGVALMGQAREYYTFFGHLRWAPAIGLGYAAAIWAHLLVNRTLF